MLFWKEDAGGKDAKGENKEIKLDEEVVEGERKKGDHASSAKPTVTLESSPGAGKSEKVEGGIVLKRSFIS